MEGLKEGLLKTSNLLLTGVGGYSGKGYLKGRWLGLLGKEGSGSILSLLRKELLPISGFNQGPQKGLLRSRIKEELIGILWTLPGIKKKGFLNFPILMASSNGSFLKFPLS